MDGSDFFIGLQKVFSQIVDFRDHIDENNHWCLRASTKDLHQTLSTLVVRLDEFDSLLDCLLVSNLSYLYHSRKLQVLPCHFLHQWLHSSREHQECLEIFLTSLHQVLLLLNE